MRPRRNRIQKKSPGFSILNTGKCQLMFLNGRNYPRMQPSEVKRPKYTAGYIQRARANHKGMKPNAGCRIKTISMWGLRRCYSECFTGSRQKPFLEYLSGGVVTPPAKILQDGASVDMFAACVPAGYQHVDGVVQDIGRSTSQFITLCLQLCWHIW